MARKKTTPSLIQQLEGKSATLVDTAKARREEAAALAQLSAAAHAESVTAENHNAAVTKAVTILTDAGVTL